MPIHVKCPTCSAVGTVPDELVGKQVKCPKCHTPFTISAATTARTGGVTGGPIPTETQKTNKPWLSKASALLTQHGTSVKFAAKMILNAILPGSPAVVDLALASLDYAQEVAKKRKDEDRPPAATENDLRRIEGIFDVLATDMQTLVAKIAALQNAPELAEKNLEAALLTDGRCQEALEKIGRLAERFDLVMEQNKKILVGTNSANEKLDDIQGMLNDLIGSGIVSFIRELKAANISTDAFPPLFSLYRRGAMQFGRGYAQEARITFLDLAKARPQSSVVAVALAGAQAASQDLAGAQQSLLRATRLNPEKAEIQDAFRRVSKLAADGRPIPARNDDQIEISTLPLHSIIVGQGVDTHALIKLCCPEASKPFPLDLVVLVDVSRFMNPDDGKGCSRLRRAQAALKNTAQRLKIEDSIAILAFADNTEMVLPWINATERGKIEYAINQIDKFNVESSKGKPHLDEALKAGRESLGLRGKTSAIGHIAVVTAGNAVGKRECRKLAEQLAEAGIGLTLLIVGEQAEEDFVFDLMERGHEVYYLDDEQSFPCPTATNWAGIHNIAFRKVELYFQPLAGVRLKRIWQVTPDIEKWGGVELAAGQLKTLLGTFQVNQEKRFLIEFSVPPKPLEGTYGVMELRLVYHGRNGPEPPSHHPFAMSYSAPSKINAPTAEVAKFVDYVRILEWTDSLKAANSGGNKSAVPGLLNQIIGLSRSLGPRAARLTQLAQGISTNLQQSLTGKIWEDDLNSLSEAARSLR